MTNAAISVCFSSNEAATASGILRVVFYDLWGIIAKHKENFRLIGSGPYG